MARLARLDRVDAELLSDALGVDEVDRRVGAVGEHSAEHARREQPRVEVGHAPAVGDLDRIDRLAGELHEQPAEARTKVHVRHELVGVVAGRRRYVDGAAQEPAAEHGSDLLGHGDAGATARVERRCIGRAREQQVGRVEYAGRRRRAHLDGHRGACDGPRGQRSCERVEVDCARRAGTDHARAGLDLRQFVGPEQRRPRRRLDHQHVGLGEDLLGRDALDRADGVGAGLGLAREHGHAQCAGPIDEQRRARTHANDAQRLAAHLDASARRAWRRSGAKLRVGGDQVAGAREHQRERVLGLGDEAGVRGVDDDDSVAGRRGDVDAGHVDAGPADYPQGVPRRQDGGVDRHARTGDQSVVPIHSGHELGFAPGGPLVDGQAVLMESGDALGGEIARRQHTRRAVHVTPPWAASRPRNGSDVDVEARPRRSSSSSRGAPCPQSR